MIHQVRRVIMFRIIHLLLLPSTITQISQSQMRSYVEVYYNFLYSITWQIINTLVLVLVGSALTALYRDVILGSARYHIPGITYWCVPGSGKLHNKITDQYLSSDLRYLEKLKIHLTCKRPKKCLSSDITYQVSIYNSDLFYEYSSLQQTICVALGINIHLRSFALRLTSTR